MNPYPALCDALAAEFRSDGDKGHFPSTLFAPNGSLLCTTDYELSGILAREIIEVRV